MKGVAPAVALALVLSGALAVALAQQPPPQPPAQPPVPAEQTPPPAAAVPRPFPEGAKVAFVVLQRIVNESAEGKAASAKIQAMQQQKAGELGERQKQLQALQQRLEKEGSVMSATAVGDLQKQIERAQVDIQRFTQDAQQDIEELQLELQQQFQLKIDPVIAQVGEEKGLHLIFNAPDSGVVWADLGLDLSADVIKRLDAAAAGKPPAQ